TYLLLFYRSRLKNFLLKLTAPKDQEKAMEIVDSVSQVAANYMTGLAKMIVVLWILYGVGFTAIGVENALFFAVICGLLELIPFIGNLTGTAITVLGVTAKGGETNMILGVIMIYGVVQFGQTYLLEPLIVGSEVHINPLFTIFSLVAAEAVWGIPGMILAIPLTGMIKIICDRIPRLQPYGYLIGSDKKQNHFGNVSFSDFFELDNSFVVFPIEDFSNVKFKKTSVMGKLSGKRIAILTEDGFEQVELTSPKEALKTEGAQVDIVSPREKVVRSKKGDDWDKEYPVDIPLNQARVNDYDGL